MALIGRQKTTRIPAHLDNLEANQIFRDQGDIRKIPLAAPPELWAMRKFCKGFSVSMCWNYVIGLCVGLLRTKCTILSKYIFFKCFSDLGQFLPSNCSRPRANKSQTAIFVAKQCSFGHIRFGFGLAWSPGMPKTRQTGDERLWTNSVKFGQYQTNPAKRDKNRAFLGKNWAKNRQNRVQNRQKQAKKKRRRTKPNPGKTGRNQKFCRI